MKRKYALIVALTIAASMCTANVGAASVSDISGVTVSEKQMVVKGSLNASGEQSVNCIVARAGADKTDLNSILFIREVKTDSNGDFAFYFVFDESAGQGEYSVRVSDGGSNVSEFDFTYYPYEDMITKVENVASASELETILKDNSNSSVLGFLGIDTALLENSAVNSNELVESLFNAAKNYNLSFDEMSDLYSKMTALAFINANQKGWLEKFNPMFESEKYADIQSSAKKEWLENKIYDNIVYSNTDSLDEKYEELSIIYLINSSGASELGTLIEKYQSKLGIAGKDYFSSYSSMSQAKKTVFISDFSKAIKSKELSSYADFRQEFEKAVKDALSSPEGGSGSGSGGGGKTGGSGSGGVSIGYSKPNGNTSERNERFLDSATFGWAKTYIDYLADKNIISGFEDGTFRPNEPVTREQFVQIIVSAFKLKNGKNATINFTDVNSDDWYYDAICAAYENGIINGVSEDEFGVGGYITRQDAATILNRVSKEKINGNLPIKTAYKFADDNTISDYAKNSVYTMYHAGIINGIGNDIFAPAECCTRAQTAKMVYYLLTKGE